MKSSQSNYEVEPRDFREMRERMKKEFFMLVYEETDEYRSYLYMNKEDFTPYCHLLIDKGEEEIFTCYIYEFPPEEYLNPPTPKCRVEITHRSQLQAILDHISGRKTEDAGDI